MYSTIQVCKILDINRECLRDWMIRGFISATIPSKGYGTKAQFTIEDIYIIYTFRMLVKDGFKRKKAVSMIRQLTWPNKILPTTTRAALKMGIQCKLISLKDIHKHMYVFIIDILRIKRSCDMHIKIFNEG